MRRGLWGGRFRRGFVATLSFDAVARISSALATVILIRALSVNAFAYVVLFLAVSQTLSTASTGGIKMRYLRSEAEAVARGATSVTSLTVPGGLALAAIAALSALGFAVEQLCGIGSGSGGRGVFWLCVLAYAAGQSLTDLLIYRAQARLSFATAGRINAARGAVFLIISLVIGVSGGYTGPAAALLLSLSLVVLGLALTFPHLSPDPRRPTMSKRLREALADTHWLSLYYVASAAYANADIFVVALVLSRLDTATLGAAERYYAIALGAVPALMSVFRVRTAQADVIDSHAVQSSLLTNWMRRVAPLAAVISLAAALVAPWALPVINGGRYPECVVVFEVLLVYAFAVYTILPAPSLLMAQHQYRLLALIATATVVANILCDVAGALLFGVVGIAVSASLVNVVSSIVTVRYALRGHPTHQPIQHALASARS
jgi:O-antigen/teichoic acid export membrane protein